METKAWLEKFLDVARGLIPRWLFATLQPVYHYALAVLGALVYGYPSRRLAVIAITGTKGKTTTAELVNAVLESAGYRTALASTLRIKVADVSQPNKFKMTIRGRFFVQHFLRRAVLAGCTHAIVEMTSEGAKQYRHKFLNLDALIFTNLAPEHIESHGSYDKYVGAKLSIARELNYSCKKRTLLIVNSDDAEAGKFLAISGPKKITYTKVDAKNYRTGLVGEFNQYNIAAAVALGRALGVAEPAIAQAIAGVERVRGRAEIVTTSPCEVVVDYAHTPESLEAIYRAFPGRRLICVLGGTGGGRDHWKRPLMGSIAERYCNEIILTDEDPYDEPPEQIVREVASGIKNIIPTVTMDRRQAISSALQHAKLGDAVIITGKGTDPYIMGPNSSKVPWDDATVVREELTKLGKNA